MNTRITKFPFDKNTLNILSSRADYANWPIVYILENQKEAYIGETTSAVRRTHDHLDNRKRDRFSHLYIIEDSTFNKSATLDIESKLIEYMHADQKYILQNGNGGLKNHNYYNKNYYKQLFEKIWERLIDEQVAQNSIKDIENSDLFKYSPFKSLTTDQSDIVESLETIITSKSKSVNIIKGEPGSGKTILAIYLVKYLLSQEKQQQLKIGLVLPQTSLRETVKKTFRHVKGLKANMVLGPNDVVNEPDTFDVLIVDEAHRLTQRRNLANYSTYDSACNKLGLNPIDSSQLDWMLIKSKHSVFLYDEKQTVKPSDVDKKAFDKIKNTANEYVLSSQLRVLAGNEFVDYIDSIFRNTDTEFKEFKGYDFFLYDDIQEMIDQIQIKDSIYGLCRVTAGYAWDWESKDDPQKYDICIDGQKLRWNSTVKDWINSPNSINEVGCIHTVQGYDLNYIGVIIGNELSFKDNKFYFHPENYKDRFGKHRSLNNEEMITYIINIYKTLITRGIRGAYVYVCDHGLREQLRKFIPTVKREDILFAAENNPGYNV